MSDYSDIHIETTLPKPWEEEHTFNDILYDWMSRAPWLAISFAAHLLAYFILASIPWRAFLGDDEKIAKHTADYEERFANPFVAAERGFIDEVIQPRSTRKRVSRAFAALRNKKRKLPWKKHDNIPL